MAVADAGLRAKGLRAEGLRAAPLNAAYGVVDSWAPITCAMDGYDMPVLHHGRPRRARMTAKVHAGTAA